MVWYATLDGNGKFCSLSFLFMFNVVVVYTGT